MASFRTAVLVACLAWAQCCTAQNSYLGLWGGALKDTAANATSGGSLGGRLHQAAEEAQSRLMQRIHSREARLSGAWNHTQALADLAALLSQQRAAPPLAEPLLLAAQGSAANASGLGGLAQLLGLHDAHAPAPEPGDDSTMLQRLHDHFGKVDAGQAAAVALLLGSLAKKAGASDATGLHAEAAATGGLLTAGLPFQQLGQPIPESHWDGFQPALCARLQNFGGAQGYRAVYLGDHPCTAAGNAASDQLAWGAEASFTADCRLDTAEAPAAAAAVPAASAAAPLTVAGRLQAAASKAAEDFNAAMQRSMQCSLAVASDSGAGATGSGAIVRHSKGVALLGGPKLNAVRIRVCNIAPTLMQSPAALHAGGTSVELHGLRLNGHTLVSKALAATQASSPDGCQVQLYRVPARSLSEGFVLSGWLGLESGSNGSGGGGSGSSSVWGVGEQSSVELQLGQFTLANALLERGNEAAAQWQVVTQLSSNASASARPPAR